MARIADASDPDAVREAARILRRGGLVAFPTETVYGLGADALNPLAVARIFEVKGRPRLDPLIVHVADAEDAARYGVFSDRARALAPRFWPGPLTLVVPKTPRVPDIVTAGLETVAIRVPSHPAALALIRAAGRPVAAPSANPFGYVSPTEASHVAAQLGGRIDLILDGGASSVGVESTILSLAGPNPALLRAGGVALEDLSALLGPVDVATDPGARPQAPGQLRRHYATRTPLEIAEAGAFSPAAGEKAGLLSLRLEEVRGYAAVEVLSPTGDLREAAARFFGALRRLDGMALDRIVARPFPETGLGRALMDRLRRAAAR
jgi:L-threonylcarbamoyladenylate synthase